MRKHLIVTAFAGVALTGLAQSPWTYSQCVDYAREHNLTLRKSLLSEETAGINLEEAKAQWEPSLDFATSQGYTNSPWGANGKNSYTGSYDLRAGWTVWNGGVRENNIKKSRLEEEISRLNTGDIARSLDSDLFQAYINILYAKESISIYEEAAQLSQAQAERGEGLMEAGRASRVDYAQLKSQAEQDRYSVVNAEGLYDTRRMELKKLLELGIDTDLTLANIDITEADILAPLPPMEESYSLAIANDLQLQGLDLDKQVSDLDVAIAKGGRLPQISISAGVGTGHNIPGMAFGNSLKQNFGENVGVTLSIPIFDNKKTKTAVARAKVEQLNADIDIDQRRIDLGQTVENWYIDTRAAQSRYLAAVEQCNAAELTANLTDEQFQLGLVNPVELLTAHNNLTEARRSLLQAKYMALLGQKMIEYYRTTKITLN